MKQVYLDDREVREHLFPFTQTRHAADIRIGILTIREKWEAVLGKNVHLVTGPSAPTDDADVVVFAANLVPSAAFITAFLKNGKPGEGDYDQVKILQYPWHIFQWNDWAIREDFNLLTRNRHSAAIPESVHVSKAGEVFIEEGARLSHCILNATTGPIYIGKNAEVMEGAVIRGPFALCEGGVVKMGARIYGATTVGPYSIAGGEIKNSVITGYSNKAHDGYLGDAVIGEWCNLGAGTSNSNIKNTASEIKVWHYPAKDYIRAGIKCGLLMGDYSRCAINTSFNSGTVVGVCANVFGEGLLPKYIPAFTWGTKGLSSYEFEKALADIGRWKKLKNKELTNNEITLLKHIFEQS